MERLTKAELANGILVCYPNNDSGLGEMVIRQNPYRNIVEKLKEYEDLEEQGKLLKLPCAVGDIVYALWSVPTEQKYVIYPAEVKEICIGIYNNRRTIKYRLEPISFRGRILNFYSDDFGKKIFLEESEAENALKQMNEMEGNK